MSFQKILDKYRKISFSERDKGDRFERLMQAYLKTDPRYAHKLKNVWMWNEFPGKLDLGGGDTGIDLVALTNDGDYWAIQCKCFQDSSTIDKPAVDSFLSTSSREFKNEELKTVSFSHRIWISTTNKWGSNASEAIRNQNPPVTRINLFDLVEAPVDWLKLDDGVHGEEARTPKKTLRPHQTTALNQAHEHFKTEDRGKLIMACGTGKTFNALRIAEHETDGKGLILFLVPSISLLGQSLREWSADANENINAICICSDPAITKKRTKNDDSDSFSIVDLALPASTDPQNILQQFEHIKRNEKDGMTVVFSTYQSIEVIARAQKVLLKNGFDPFDLIICDEAHRTTGVSVAGKDESAFTKVHDADFLQAKKRLYMTATPRLYSADTKSKAAQADAVLCSMDDEDLYGKEIYRIGFGEAVDKGLLTDYKVLILTLNDQDVPEAYRKVLTQEKVEINTDDASKIIGTINALSKQFLGDQSKTIESDPNPMKRAVAFCPSIAGSKQITSTYNIATDAYLGSLPADKKEAMVSVSSQHMDGTMAAPERDEMLAWLKEETEDNDCRVITNVKVLSEGVDVPSLDSVLFLSARNSEVDVVQSVGRVMRLAPGKKYGYIIIPVVVPSDVKAEEALGDNERYKVVWTVLNALRAHDDRFNATVNKIDLNRKKPNNINVVGTRFAFDENDGVIDKLDDSNTDKATQELNRQLGIQFEQLQSVVYARMVEKVGNRRYWEEWATDVAKIAERQIERIKYLIDTKSEQRKAFENFLTGLQKNINPSITKEQAIDMLAQHIITQPIFEALFDGYSFAKTNPVSVAMQTMMDALEEGSNLAEQDETLQKFYDSVRSRAAGIDNATGKQRIIIELYDKFFKTAFPKMVEQLGIVYTPVEVVDFIIHSVNDVLKKEFGRSISDENVHVLDPFTGTGTFITRLLQSGLIDTKDLARKYRDELHANEIVLLAYYIAAVNIENAFHDQLTEEFFEKGEGEVPYEPFEGIVLTDTFQLGETDESEKLFSDMFPQNSARVEKQKKAPLRVIMGNPPYSVGQKSANDNAQNLKYEKLDGRISNTYAKATKATNKNSLYDSYIKAIRWSTDRLDPENGGIISFITNSGWLDKGASDGLRKCLEDEFSSVYVFDLRGAIRGKSGEAAKREGQNVFDIMTGVAITILVKKPSSSGKAEILYKDIGEYLKRAEKINFLKKFQKITNPEIEIKQLKPNEHGDWLNQRNDAFQSLIPLGDKGNKLNKMTVFVSCYSNGLKTQRDAWCYNSSKSKLGSNIQKTFNFYNSQRKAFHSQEIDAVSYDSKKISWTTNLLNGINKNRELFESNGEYVESIYRPFFKQNVFFSRDLNERVYQQPKLYPTFNHTNITICVSGLNSRLDSTSVIISNRIVDLNCLDSGTQCFPLFYYEEREKQSPGLFDAGRDSEYTRRDGVSDFILTRAKKQYGKNISKEDIFYYVYGILHSEDYRKTFTNDLKKMLPRLPLVEDVRDFWKFSKAGRALAELHIDYEEVAPAPGVLVFYDRIPQAELEKGMQSGDIKDISYKVEKMRFPKKGQKGTIIYNHQITIENIPERAYEYVVNGKPAIEWIMERYQITTHKDSSIVNNPNDWAEEVGKPRYILDLLLSIINVSLQTVEIVEGLPNLDFGETTSEENSNFQEYEVVVSTAEISNVPIGTTGTIVHIHEEGKAYEAEFIVNDNSIVETVVGTQIKKQ